MLQERRKTLVLVLVLTYPFILYGLIRGSTIHNTQWFKLFYR